MGRACLFSAVDVPHPPAGFRKAFMLRGGFRPLGDLLCPRRQRRQNAARGVPRSPHGSSGATPGPPFTGVIPSPSTEVPARKIRFRVSILSGPLGPGAVQNFSFCHFTAAPGSDQPWQRVRDRVCAGRSRSYEPGAGGPVSRPYGVLTVPSASGKTGAVSWLLWPSYFP